MTREGTCQKSAEQSSEPGCGLKTVTLPFLKQYIIRCIG